MILHVLQQTKSPNSFFYHVLENLGESHIEHKQYWQLRWVPNTLVLGFGCPAGKDAGQKTTNISLARKYFQQLPLNFQRSFTSAMPWLFTWAMFQEMIGIFKTCKMLEYPVGNTRPKAWKNMLTNYIQHFYLYIGRDQKSARNYWKPPRTSGHLIQNACKPAKGLLVSQLRLHPLDKLPHGNFSAKHQANTQWTKHPRADLEVPNCHRHTRHHPR